MIMKNEISILYNDSFNLTLGNLNQLIQCITALADCVWLNVEVKPCPSLGKKDIDRIYDLLESLEDKGIVKRWGYPYQEEMQASNRVRVLKHEEYAEIYDRINETFLTDKRLIPLVNLDYLPTNQTIKQTESTSKIIALRKDYWAFGISHLLGANRLMCNSNIKARYRSLSYSEIHRLGDIEGALVGRILELYDVPELSLLDVNDIAALRKHNKGFRQKIKQLGERVLYEGEAHDYLETVMPEIRTDMAEILDRLYKSDTRKALKIGRDIGYTLAGLAYPVVAALPLGEAFVSWLTEKRGLGYILFILEVKKRTKTRKRRKRGS